MIVRLTLVNEDPAAESGPLHDRLTALPLAIEDDKHRTDADVAWAWVDVSVLDPTEAMRVLRAIDDLELGPVRVEVVS